MCTYWLKISLTTGASSYYIHTLLLYICLHGSEEGSVAERRDATRQHKDGQETAYSAVVVNVSLSPHIIIIYFLFL